MQKGTMVALVLLVLGLLMVVIAVPNLSTQVEVIEEITLEASRTNHGPFDLPRGSYTIWFEDFREGEEWRQWNTFLLNSEEDVIWGSWPSEPWHREFNGIECELLGVVGNIPAGQYTLGIEGEAIPLNGTTFSMYLVRSPGTIEGFFVVTGLTLVIVATVVVLLTRKRPVEVSHAC